MCPIKACSPPAGPQPAYSSLGPQDWEHSCARVQPGLRCPLALLPPNPHSSSWAWGVSCSSSRPKASQKGLSHLQSWVSRLDNSGSEAWELIPTGLSWVPTNGEVGVRKTTLIIWGEHHSVPLEVQEPNLFSLFQL